MMMMPKDFENLNALPPGAEGWTKLVCWVSLSHRVSDSTKKLQDESLTGRQRHKDRSF